MAAIKTNASQSTPRGALHAHGGAAGTGGLTSEKTMCCECVPAGRKQPFFSSVFHGAPHATMLNNPIRPRWLRDHSCPFRPPASSPSSSPISTGAPHNHHRDRMASLAERSPELRELPAPIARAADVGVAPIIRRQTSRHHSGHERLRSRRILSPNYPKELPE